MGNYQYEHKNGSLPKFSRLPTYRETERELLIKLLGEKK